MVAITKLIMLGIAVVCAVTLAFIVFEFVEDKVMSKFSKKINRVHFYVARDMDESLWLYLGKPIRVDGDTFISNKPGCAVPLSCIFNRLGLNKDDFKYLKWEDEPVEVFLNMED